MKFFSPSKKINFLKYQGNVTYLVELLTSLDERNKTIKINYDEIISTYENQILKFKEILNNKEKNVRDYEKLFERGKCSVLDFEAVKVSYKESKCVYQNLQDSLWLYKWKRSQCK